MSKCIQCDDLIIVEGEGCPKCNNRFCGACCELDSPICGDHLTLVRECGCKL